MERREREMERRDRKKVGEEMERDLLIYKLSYSLTA